jgi:hypothetical protein
LLCGSPPGAVRVSRTGRVGLPLRGSRTRASPEEPPTRWQAMVRQLGSSQLEETHQLGRGPEGVGDRPAAVERERRDKLAVLLRDERAARRRVCGIELREALEGLDVGKSRKPDGDGGGAGSVPRVRPPRSRAQAGVVGPTAALRDLCPDGFP